MVPSMGCRCLYEILIFRQMLNERADLIYVGCGFAESPDKLLNKDISSNNPRKLKGQTTSDFEHII